MHVEMLKVFTHGVHLILCIVLQIIEMLDIPSALIILIFLEVKTSRILHDYDSCYGFVFFNMKLNLIG